MGKLDGKVAFITGAARGQGRSHALMLAAEGADIIAMDLCDQVPSVGYPMSRPSDLAETVRLVERLDRRIVAETGDVRSKASLRSVLNKGLGELGRLDIVLANAGIMAHGLPPYPNSDQAWQDSLDIMLTGVWNTLQVTVPVLLEADRGGAIVITSSTIGLRSVPTNFDGGYDGYGAAKVAVISLMRSYAGRLAPRNIRVNTVHPTGVATGMVQNDFFPEFVRQHPFLEPTLGNPMPVGVIEPEDVSRAILYLVSDDGRYVTGQTLAIDGGKTSIITGTDV